MGLTLWGESAEVQGAELEQSEDAIISISNCRVGEFNGAPTNSLASPATLSTYAGIAEMPGILMTLCHCMRLQGTVCKGAEAG